MKISDRIRKILSLVIVFLFIGGDVCYATMSQNIKFNNITIEDGLSQSTVEAMYQDSRGYIWIGTDDGLNRYNGNKFKVYKNDKYNKNSLVNNAIIDIKEDKNGDMWISTLDGISRINVDTDTIKNYNSDENNGNLSADVVCQILSTKNNKIIAATENGINIYDEEKDTFFRALDKDEELPSQYIYSIKEDSRGYIWIGTENGLVEFDEDLNKVNSYEDTIGNVEVYNTYDDLNGNIWVCTLGSGLFRINLNNNSIDNYKNNDDEHSILSDYVRDTLLDCKGKLWIATDEGLCDFDCNEEIFTSYKKELYEKDSLVDDKTICLLEDSSGLIWIGAYSGISIFNPNNNFYHYKSKPFNDNSLSGNIINSIYKETNGTLWVGTNDNGINIINGEDINYLNKDNSNIPSNSIHDIVGYRNYIFIGTNEGLSVLNKNNDGIFDIRNYTSEDGLPANKIRSLIVDSKGKLWIGTNQGLAIFDIASGKFIDKKAEFEKIGIADEFIRAIYEDSKGNIYIGCFLEGGLVKISPDFNDYKIFKNDDNDNESISNNTILYINEDLYGDILVGTNHGFNVLNPNTEKFTHYTENDGLINNTVYGILVDKNNDVWMSTNGGISKFDINQKTFKNFTATDGLQSNEFNGKSCYNSNDGYLYFGGINGFNVIDVDNVELCEFQSKVIFDSFEVNGISTKDISNEKFSYNCNNIKVNFFTNDYKDSKNTKYYYRLKGLEESWSETNNNSLIFAKLAPGYYKLEIKTITKQGIISEVTSVNFTINTPFWKSTYAIVIYCVLIILAIYRYRSKVKRLDKLVNKKTIELKEQMDKNEELFNHVLQLERNKNIYVINLSHELRTPLNVLSSINQLIKSFTDNDKTISNEKLSYYMDIMNRNCTRLLRLINNLIDYAKIENNRYTLDKECVNIVYLVEETVLDMKDYIEEKGLELIFDTNVEEKSIECDKVDIERCVINLVSNAVKFTHEGGLIKVFVEVLDDEVKIGVRDTGIGISEENQRIIFDRFNQGVDRTSEQKGGSGLGLTITKQLITLHGGDIEVKSEVNVGSEFVITLPLSN